MRSDEAKQIWEAWRQTNMIDEVECRFLHSSVPGVGLVEAVHPAFHVPIGMAYFQETYDGRISLSYINVVEQLRRLGIGRKILHALADRFPKKVLVTSIATDLARPFLLKLGWVAPSEKTDYWFCP